MTIDDEFHGGLTVKAVQKLIATLKKTNNE